MKRLLSIINLIGGVLFCHGADIATVRQPGGGLDTSVRNEVDNAKRLAAEWLVARQHLDGSWGSTSNNTVLTPIVWFALKGVEAPIDAVARDRAVVWTDNQPIEGGASFDAHLWRLILIRYALPDTLERQMRILVASYDPAMLPLFAHTTTSNWWLWYEVTNPSQKLDLNSIAKQRLALIAPDYPLDTKNTETFWFISRLINRYSGGVWMRGTEALDWRNDFGLALVNAMRKDPKGGGYWDGETDDAKIRATAFALLALREID
jgi:hypothetical protein